MSYAAALAHHTRTPTLHEALSLVLRYAASLSRAHGAVVELPEDRDLVYRAATGTIAHHVGLRIPQHGSLAGEAFRTGLLLTCDDSESDIRVDRAGCRRIGVRAMVCVPLIHEHDVLGVLKVVSANPGAFTLAHERALASLAELSAPVLASALDV